MNILEENNKTSLNADSQHNPAEKSDDLTASIKSLANASSEKPKKLENICQYIKINQLPKWVDFSQSAVNEGRNCV